MAPVVEVRVMGDPGVSVDGRTVAAMASMRVLSLLGLLVVQRETPMLRQRVAFALWPESTEPQARTNLRQALHHLKRGLPDSARHLDVDGPTLAWRLDSPARVDLIDLDAATTRAADADADRQTIEQAVVAYPGDLLVGCDDEWVRPIRERLHREQLERLEGLVDRCDAEGDAVAAIRWAHRVLDLDPLHEATYRRLMRLHGPADRARAVRTYHACVTVLERELGIAPSADTVAVYERVLAERVDSTSLGRPPAPAPRLVGRVAEQEVLRLAVRRAASGTCQVVLVHGEPGIGKSRLVADVVGWCERHSMATVSTRAYQAEGRLPFAPVADVLRSTAIRPAIGRIDAVWADELARIVPDVLAERDVRPPPAIVDGGERTRLFTATSEAIAALGRPLVVALDDLQWCDTETLELLHFVVRTSRGVPLVILGTARDDGLDGGPLGAFVAAMRSIDALVDVPVGRLDRDDAATLVTAAIGHRPGEAVLERVLAAGDGNPLFLVELARGDIEPTSGQLALPSKVQAVIEARLADLSPGARAVAEILAVVGRRADVDLLARARPAGHNDLATALDELWRRRIVVEIGADEYDFGHDRIRDVAYGGVGPARRRALHRAVADAVRARPGGVLDDVAAAVATHYERAGVVDAALDHYLIAVEAATRVFAHGEVIVLAQRGLALLDRLPDGPERIARELSFLGPLAVAIHAGPGMSPQHQYVFDRIAALRAEDRPPIDAGILRLVANSAIVHRRFHEAAVLGADLLARAEADNDGLLLTEGHYVCGVSAFWLGELARSAEHLQRSLAAYDADRLPMHLRRFGQDPRSVCLVRLAMTSTHLGRIRDAKRLRDDALRQATSADHDYTTQYVHVFAAWAALDGEAIDVVRELVSTPLPRTNLLAELALGAFGAWTAIVDGSDPGELDRLADIADATQTQLPGWEPKVLLLLADALGRLGRDAEGLEAVRRAGEIARREMPVLLAEAWWLEAELLRRLHGPPADVAHALGQAYATATAQGSLLWRQRAQRTAAACGLVEGERPATR